MIMRVLDAVIKMNDQIMAILVIWINQQRM